MVYADFIGSFPEFAGAPQALIQAKLDEAARNMDLPVWGALADDGISYLAAHKLATSPAGQNARLITKDGTSTYLLEYRRLCRIVGSGFRVIL